MKLVRGSALLTVLAVSVAFALGTPPRPARINHVVFFKLHDPARADELIADCDELMAEMSMVRSYFAGKHLDMGRSIVDGDYDVGFYIGFDELEDFHAYRNHPRHRVVIDKWASGIEWIRIHDVLDDTP